MALPKQIQEQSDKADAAMEKLKEQETGKVETTQNVEPQLPEPPNEVPAPPIDVDWEHKYKSLQGVHQADKGAYDEHTGQLRRMIEGLQSQIEDLKTIENEPDAEPDSFGDDLARFQADFGDEAGKVINSLAARNKALEERFGQLEQQVGGVKDHQQVSAVNTFQDKLEGMVTDIWTVNKDPVFIAWLNEMEPLAGKSRHDLLTEAFNNQDAKRVASFFQSFLGNKAPPVQEEPTDKQARLEKQLQPGKSRGQVPTGDKPTFTIADLKKFNNDVIKGKYSRDPDKVKKMEREFDIAAQEGRLT